MFEITLSSMADFDEVGIGDLDEDQLTRLMPINYVCWYEYPDHFQILTRNPLVLIGHCEMTEAGLRIEVPDDTDEGRKFWAALARKYPQSDPRTIYYGIVCEDGGLYYLGGTGPSKEGLMENLDDQAKSASCYLVQFMQGHLHERELVVLSMKRIMPNGGLNGEVGMCVLALGSSES